MLHGDSLKDTASKLILKAACPKCKEILDIMARPAKEHKGESDNGPKGPKAKRKKLSEDPIALAKIKEMWSHSPRPTLTAMAKETGYSKSTISDNIKKRKEKGELE